MIYRVWWLLLVPLIRLYWRVRVTGAENVRRRGGMIIASNHQSGIDPILVCASFWRHVYWLAKVELVITRKVAWFFKSVAVIPVDRNAPKEDSLQAAADCVRRGRIFGIYPEGTRSPDEKVYRGHTGVARIAHLSGGAVIPTAVIGSRRSVPKGKLMARPTKCVVRFGAPMTFAIKPGETEAAAYRRFTDDVMRAIAALAGTSYVPGVYSGDAARVEKLAS
ncbi:MAG TPA: lysophospholipid acyltransferase family protein [Actinomycetota bacterium]|nr:lysophospholipid acyltransferase family protein [Actinomycetota bacterium]